MTGEHGAERNADVSRPLKFRGASTRPSRLRIRRPQPEDCENIGLDAIGQLGGPGELDVLEQYTTGLARSFAVKQRATAAIVAIKERRTGAAGHLSLADPSDAGALSLNDVTE